MKQFVLWSALSVLIASPALAADLPVPHRQSYYKAPAYLPPPTWTGCYIGGNVGAAWSHTNVNDEAAPFGPIATLDDTDIAGGGQVGCDYQFPGNWVIGVQGMFEGTGLNKSTTSPALGPLTLNGKIPWVTTVTGRLGYAVAPNWLIYAKGGAAWTHTDSSLLFTPNGTTVDSVGFDQSGWTAGGGAEWRIAQHWSLFAEYDYLGFADKTVYFPNSNNIGTIHQNVQLGLVGVNFHFGGM